MRVLLVCRSFPPRVSGRSSHCHDLALALAQAGHSVAVVAQYRSGGILTPYGDGKPVSVPGVDVSGVVELGDDDDITRLTRAVRRASERFRPDVVHAHAVYPPGFSALLAVGGDIPVVLTAHGGDGTRLARCCEFHRLTSVWTLNNVSTLMYVSESYGRRIETLHGRTFARSVVALNPIDTTRFRPRQVNGDQRVTGPQAVLFHGRVERQKGVDVFLKAARMLKANSTAEFLVSGTGRYLDEAKRLTSRLDLNSRVEFLGYVPYQAAATVYQRADVYALPTEHEGCGLTLLEAMASGVPIVSTRVPGVTDLLTNGENALLVEPHDPRGIADALRRLLGSSDLRARFAAAGRRCAEEKHAWPSRLAQFVTTYQAAHRLGPTRFDSPRPDPSCPFRLDPSRL